MIKIIQFKTLRQFKNNIKTYFPPWCHAEVIGESVHFFSSDKLTAARITVCTANKKYFVLETSNGTVSFDVLHKEEQKQKKGNTKINTIKNKLYDLHHDLVMNTEYIFDTINEELFVFDPKEHIFCLTIECKNMLAHVWWNEIEILLFDSLESAAQELFLKIDKHLEEKRYEDVSKILEQLKKFNVVLPEKYLTTVTDQLASKRKERKARLYEQAENLKRCADEL